MECFKNSLNLYRERVCKIENKNIQIENLLIDGLSADDERIEKIRKDIKKMESENRIIDNIVELLPDKEHKVIRLIYLQGKEKATVARELDRTERQVNRIINRALQRGSKDFVV